MIEFNFFLLASSLKMIEPNFLRSKEPSGSRMDVPKYLTIFARAGVPGWTTERARMSASTTGIFLAFKREEVVDFPVAIPPVNPITSGSLG